MSFKRNKSPSSPINPPRRYTTCSSLRQFSDFSSVQYVKIIVHSASNLPSDKHGATGYLACNPHIVIDTNNEHLKSNVLKSQNNPNFDNETFYIKIDVENQSFITINIYDWHNFTPSRYIGHCNVQLDKLIRDTEVRSTLPLKSNTALNATIDVTIAANNFGLPKIEGSTSGIDFLCTSPVGLDPVQVVVSKIEDSLYSSQFDTQDKLIQYASYLSSIQKIKETYLNVNWAKTIQLQENLDDDVVEITDPTDYLGPIQQEIDLEASKRDIEEIKNNTSRIDTTLRHKVSIKIVIIDQQRDSRTKRSFREAFSPILSTFNMIPKLGFFHSALIVGPWLIEWNNSGLCVPRKCLSSASMLSADLDAITTMSDLNKLVDDIAEVIVDWNTRMKYSSTNKDSKHYGNCQDFIESLCLRSGIRLPNTGPLAGWLERLRKNGECDLDFTPEANFKREYGITSNVLKFKTHTELDSFVKMLKRKNPHLHEPHDKDYEVYMFLKAIDRAFWLRHLKLQDQIRQLSQKLRQLGDGYSNLDLKRELFEEHSKLEKTGEVVTPLQSKKLYEGDESHEEGLLYLECECPFGDPSHTHSYFSN
ncbi:hypothetical protein AKO1_010791 [Acrasis kona]|uniref:C2 domain-containing protein n=1 Tax=Acrasis kona TaxID=1008807 RepID=A0AAW2YME0_9EUKA